MHTWATFHCCCQGHAGVIQCTCLKIGLIQRNCHTLSLLLIKQIVKVLFFNFCLFFCPRLSDFLFVAARLSALREGQEEKIYRRVNPVKDKDS